MSHFSVKITVGDFCPVENLRAREISGQTRWCGELQNFRARRDVEHDAAPFAVEGRQNGIYVDVRITAPKMHREAAERAVGMRRVGVHKPEP